MTISVDAVQKEQQKEQQRRQLAEKQHADDMAPLRHLTQRYRKASGDAYADGKDREAEDYRKAVAELEALLLKLPGLPGPTVRG